MRRATLTISLKMHSTPHFEDADGKMNLSAGELGYEILLISQFTLFGDARKGNRPSFSAAARPETAIPVYEKLIDAFRTQLHTETGIFGADMQVELVNDGPVTILLDSKKRFNFAIFSLCLKGEKPHENSLCPNRSAFRKYLYRF